MVEKRQEYLTKIIEENEIFLNKHPVPEGSIRAVKHGGKYQYYLLERPQDNKMQDRETQDKKPQENKSQDRKTQETATQENIAQDKKLRYLKVGENNIAKEIVQGEYREKIIEKAKEELKGLNYLRKLYLKGRVEEVYDNICLGKQILIDPIIETDEQFIDRYVNAEYEELGFMNDTFFYSNRGEKMRSKSEVIIANMLDGKGINYIYEMPVTLKNNIVVHPDFTILNPVRREIILWEHFGMMDNLEYLQNALNKLRDYEMSGYYLGERLIISEETSERPLDVRLIKNKIEHLFVERLS